MRIEHDAFRLRSDGERKLVRSASLDYFRLPSHAAWRDRIEKIVDAGFDCVALSYPWAYHCDAPGVYDWSGIRDVEVLHDMLQEAGLYLIARPGPYVGADLDAGGLPAWLLQDRTIELRCRTNGEVHPSPEFMRCVSEWYGEIAPRIARCHNLILVEVEHQYSLPAPLPLVRSDFGALLGRLLGPSRLFGLIAWWQGSPFLVPPERDVVGGGQRNGYMRELCELLRKHGVSVPLTHADLSRGVRQMDVDLPALERRALAPCGLDAEVAAVRGDFRARPEGVPLIYLGLDAGSSDGWGGPGFERRREEEWERPIEARVVAALAEGAAVFNVRRLCGGTNWGYMAAPSVYTSYDSAAPVGEGGRTREAYDALRRVNDWLDRFGDELADTELVEHRSEGPVLIWRRASASRRFCFVQSVSPRAERLAFEGESRVELAPFETQIRVYDATDRLESVSDPLRTPRPTALARETPPVLPALDPWTFCGASPQLEPAFDDESWSEIPSERVERQEIDMDSLGVHHGFIWYRGTFSGSLDRLVLAARHSYSVWLNKQLIAEGDPAPVHPLGLEPASRRLVQIPPGICNAGRNALVILVENLGHSDGILANARARRGLLHLDTGATTVRWRFRGGLVRGEGGLAPLVVFDAVERTGSTDVSLPHAWAGEPDGVGLYETRFRLEGLDPKSGSLALRFDPGRGKANLYVNGYLLGRYWPERGPQQEFFLPWGVLEPDSENHVAVAVWKRADRAALGHLRLVLAP